MNPQHPIKPDEARAALDIMLGTERRLESMETRETGSYLLIWGLVYLLVPIVVLLFPHQSRWAANMLIPMGAIATSVIASKSPLRSEMGNKIWMFWLVAFAFAPLWIVILAGDGFPALKVTLDSRQVWAFGVTIAMMVYILMGLIFNSRLLIVLGVGVSLVTLGAFFFAWEARAFWTWMAMGSGVPLFIAGMVCLFWTPKSTKP